ncbi:MAG: hypothetical protein K2X99_11295 [Gemmatimonadaceae bacterium]|nr:hypothetical protein [Gemmatimonadaceae bacterium]
MRLAGLLLTVAATVTSAQSRTLGQVVQEIFAKQSKGTPVAGSVVFDLDASNDVLRAAESEALRDWEIPVGTTRGTRASVDRCWPADSTAVVRAPRCLPRPGTVYLRVFRFERVAGDSVVHLEIEFLSTRLWGDHPMPNGYTLIHELRRTGAGWRVAKLIGGKAY